MIRNLASVSFWYIKHECMYLTISTSALNDNILRVVLLEPMDGFDDDEWAEMQAKYVDYIIKEISEIKAALNSGDYDALRVFGHNIKGSGGMYGFDDITSIGSMIEALAKAENLSSLLNEINKLEENLKAKNLEN